MKRHARLLTAAAGVLFAVAVAVPVLAGTLRGDPAISGTARLYEQRATAGPEYGDWEIRRPGAVRAEFDTRVDPWSLTFALNATHLRRNTPYALMNPLYQGYDPDQDLAFAVVRVLAQGTSNRAGLLTLRGSAGGRAVSLPLYDEAQFPNVTILGVRVTRLASGADL